eukprot:800143_1
MQYIQGLKLNMETQIMVLQDAHLNAETISAMKTSASAMKCTVKESDLDKADELMDVNEAMDQVNEMNEAMNQPLGTMMNDDEFLVEFEESEESSDVGVPVLTGSMLTSMPVMGTFSACAVGSVDTC